MSKGPIIASAVATGAIFTGIYASSIEGPEATDAELAEQSQSVEYLARQYEGVQGSVGVLVTKLYGTEDPETGTCVVNFMAEETASTGDRSDEPWTTELIRQIPGCENSTDSVILAARNVDDGRNVARAALNDYTAEATALHDMTPQSTAEKILRYAGAFSVFTGIGATAIGLNSASDYFAGRKAERAAKRANQ